MTPINFIKRYAAATLRGLYAPLQIAFEHRYLLFLLIRRDISTRTSGTLLGSIWLLLQPGLQILGFWFLLGVVLKIKFSGGVNFIDYFLIGMLPWLFISEVLSRSLSILSEFGGIYRRAVFPVAILPLLTLLLSGTLYTLIMVIIVAWLRGPLAAFAALPVIPLLALWLIPACYVLSVIGLFLKDIGQFFPFMITVMLYLSPILYMPDLMPSPLHWILHINPVADVMALIHAAVQALPWHSLNILRPLILWLLLLGPAWLLFRRAEPHMREMI